MIKYYTIPCARLEINLHEEKIHLNFRKKCLKALSALLYFTAFTALVTLSPAYAANADTKIGTQSVATVSKTQPTPGLRTIKNFLNTALQPVGSALYVWGGGWYENKDGSSGCTHIGVNPEWKRFFDSQDSKYDWHKTKFKTELGLDCSGYVGWVIYNTLNSTPNLLPGYTSISTDMAKSLSEKYHLGTFISSDKLKDYKPGDVMSGNGQRHVWICIGQCSDKSVVFLHSSHQGVHICGTQTPSGSNDSEAYKLAKKYMEKYFPDFSSKFSIFKEYPDKKDCPVRTQFIRNTDYLTKYHQMRWTALDDPDGYLSMDPESILQDLFGENTSK